MMEAVFIARHLPGFGDPFRLTLAQWNSAIDRLTDVLEQENPPADGQKRVEKSLHQVLRKKRRAKAREKYDGAG